MRPAGFGCAAALLLSGCAQSNQEYSATVQTESVAVGSQVGGRVAAIYVAPGKRVARGFVLLRLDDSMLRAQADQAHAQTLAAAEQLAEAEHGNIPSDVARAAAQSAQAGAQYRQTVAQIGPESAAQAATVRNAEAALRDARATLRLAKIDYERERSLAASGDVPRQSLDQARADYAGARARVAQAVATLAAAQQNDANLVEAQLPGQRAAAKANAAAQAANYRTVREGTRAEEIAQARARLGAAAAAENYARARLDEAVVRSPTDGVVESFNLHVGDLLNPNETAAIVDEFVDPYVYLYASQRDLAALGPGTRLRLSSDAGAGDFDGLVEAHDRSAQFTPQNTETADQRAELVYGVKVRIHDPHHDLLDGTTVTVRVK